MFDQELRAREPAVATQILDQHRFGGHHRVPDLGTSVALDGGLPNTHVALPPRPRHQNQGLIAAGLMEHRGVFGPENVTEQVHRQGEYTVQVIEEQSCLGQVRNRASWRHRDGRRSRRV